MEAKWEGTVLPGCRAGVAGAWHPALHGKQLPASCPLTIALAVCVGDLPPPPPHPAACDLAHREDLAAGHPVLRPQLQHVLDHKPDAGGVQLRGVGGVGEKGVG